MFVCFYIMCIFGLCQDTTVAMSWQEQVQLELDFEESAVRRSSYSLNATVHPAQISYYQVTLYTRAVNTSNMSWPWRTWDWFEEYQDILFFNGQSEERFQEGKLHFVGGHRYNINQMSRLWQGGKHPRIMHHQGINSRCPFCFTYPIVKHTTDLDHFLCNMHKLTNDWEADLFYSGHILSRLFHCIQSWGMWRWTQMHYGQGLSLWSRELYKVQRQPFMLC